MKNVKIITFYLPQFHAIPENDEWWGEDFTEWVNVKKAKPLFDGHNQPKVPLNNNYYDLSNDETKIWQAHLAKEYGVYGFCYYHYWFNGKMLLQKPMEQMLSNEFVDIPFCISWANASWTKEWVGDAKKVLMNQTYGGLKDWEAHYDYLRKFFKDKRYIFCDEKPLFIIYNPVDVPKCKKMMTYFKKRAIDDGFKGICFVSQTASIFSKKRLMKLFDYNIEFQPTFALNECDKERYPFLRIIKRTIVRAFGPFFKKIFHFDLQAINGQKKARQVDYETVWNRILKESPVSPKSFPGAFAKWDNTPRKGERGLVYVNATPEKFKEYLKKQVERSKDIYKKDFLFLYAWNEWAEGGYVEPDTNDGFAYLQAIKESLES